MGLEYNFVCQSCNEIYDLGKTGNAVKLLPYLRERHKYCNCGVCVDYDIQSKMIKDPDFGYCRADDIFEVRIKVFEPGTLKLAYYTLTLNNPTTIPYRCATFWDGFRTWVEKGKTAVLRDLRLRFKMVHGLRSDWWEDDQAIDRDIEMKMKRLNHFIDRVELVDEDIIDDIIDEVLSRNMLPPRKGEL